MTSVISVTFMSQERLGFLEKLCDLGIPAAAVANLNDREVWCSESDDREAMGRLRRGQCRGNRDP